MNKNIEKVIEYAYDFYQKYNNECTNSNFTIEEIYGCIVAITTNKPLPITVAKNSPLEKYVRSIINLTNNNPYIFVFNHYYYDSIQNLPPS